MGDRIQVDPAALAQPAGRFAAGASSLEQLGAAVRQTLEQAGQAAAHPTVVGAAQTFGTATGAVLAAFGAESRTMADKITAAAVTYDVTDRTALSVDLQSMGVPPR